MFSAIPRTLHQHRHRLAAEFVDPTMTVNLILIHLLLPEIYLNEMSSSIPFDLNKICEKDSYFRNRIQVTITMKGVGKSVCVSAATIYLNTPERMRYFRVLICLW